MKISDTKISGLKIVETKPFVDHRGSFARWFCMKELSPVLEGRSIVQINDSKSIKTGTVRGLHFQKPPGAEMKIVRCVRGRAWDVAVDLRAGSRTFLQWHAEELTPENNRMMAVPEGFAHGYQSLEPDSELLYFNTAFYDPSIEGAVNPNDPLIDIKWPVPVVNLSERDGNTPFLTKDFKGLAL